MHRFSVDVDDQLNVCSFFQPKTEPWSCRRHRCRLNAESGSDVPQQAGPINPKLCYLHTSKQAVKTENLLCSSEHVQLYETGPGLQPAPSVLEGGWEGEGRSLIILNDYFSPVLAELKTNINAD